MGLLIIAAEISADPFHGKYRGAAVYLACGLPRYSLPAERIGTESDQSVRLA
jgi:hypothetical protein